MYQTPRSRSPRVRRRHKPTRKEKAKKKAKKDKQKAVEAESSIPKLAVTVQSKPRTLPDAGSVILAQAMYEQCGLDGVVPFEVHAQMMLVLLQNWHNTVGQERRDARHGLEIYIFSTSAVKMKNRSKLGSANNCNFLHFIQQDMDHPEAAEMELDTLDKSEKPTESQQRLMRACMNGRFCEEITEIFQELDLMKPIFDVQGRVKVLKLLQALLKLLESRLNTAASAQMSKANDRWRDIYSSAIRLGIVYSYLTDFVESFNIEAQSILIWIQKYFKISRTRGQISQPQKITLALRGGTLPPLSPFAIPPPTEQIANDSVDNVDESETDELIELEDLEFKQGAGGWNVAAFRWIVLCATHLKSLRQLEPSAGGKRKTLSEILTKAKLNSLIITTDKKDNQMGKLRPLIAQLVLPEDFDDTISALDSMTNLTFKDEGMDKVTTNAVLHCETILISLHLLAEQNVALGFSNPAFKIPPDILTQFKGNKFLGNVVSVSKRCCPACNRLIQHVRENQPNVEKKLICGGWHTQWSAVALPPFLPASAAKFVVDYANEELRNCLKLCLERYRASMSPKRDRSYSPNTDTEGSPPKKHRGEETEEKQQIWEDKLAIFEKEDDESKSRESGSE